VYLEYVVAKINYENRHKFLSPNLSGVIKEGSKIWKNGTTKHLVPVHVVYLVLAKEKCIILTRRTANVTG
jgi:hypothetical protein